MLRGFAFNKWDIFPLYSLHIDSLSFVLPRNRRAHAGCLASFENYHRHGEAMRLLTQWLGQREMGSCGEMVNVNLNRGGNVIISKSAEPSRPGVAAQTATLHPERVGPRDWGHDCQSHPEDLCPLPPNSVSTCRLIKVLRIEEFVQETWPKSMS